MSFTSTHQPLTPETHHYSLARNNTPLSFKDTLHLWQHDEPFRDYFLFLLTASVFSAYRWETPPITGATITRPFEFVLINTPDLDRPADRKSFAAPFANLPSHRSSLAFPNLGKDATLIAPRPTPTTSYTHLASFTRTAPQAELHEFWQTVGSAVTAHLSHKPLWLSTAGMGVAWLHLRIDSRPKYYHHIPYRTAS